MLKLIEMEVWVQLANKEVIKYDKNWNQIRKYNSVKECMDDNNLSDWKLRNISNNKKEFNGFYYIIQPHKPYYVDVECENCGKTFPCERFRTEQHKHIFCSKECEGKWRKAQTPLNTRCAFCGKKIHIKPSHIAKCKKNYCSVECLNKDKKIRYLHFKLSEKNDFIEYCKKYNLNIDKVYNNHLYNIEHYKYISA